MIEHTNNIDIGQVEVVYNVESYAPRRHFFGAGSQFWCIFGRMTLVCVRVCVCACDVYVCVCACVYVCVCARVCVYCIDLCECG